MRKKTFRKKFLTKKEAKYVLTALENIGRLSPDGRRWFVIKIYNKKRLDIYKRESNIDNWRNNERLLGILKQQARKK